MKDGNTHSLDRRIALRDEDRQERRIGSDMDDSLGCAPLLIMGVGLVAYAWITWHASDFIESTLFNL